MRPAVDSIYLSVPALEPESESEIIGYVEATQASLFPIYLLIERLTKALKPLDTASVSERVKAANATIAECLLVSGGGA